MMKVLWSEQMIVNLLRHKLLAAGAGLLLGLAGNVAWAQSYVNATVDGQLAPGVYGRIQIGSGGPPPLIYAEPVIIQRPPVAVHRSPITCTCRRGMQRTGPNTVGATTPVVSRCTS